LRDITIILPTKNEEETLPKILPLLRDYNVIIVDDSDNDLTRQASERVGGCVFLKGVGNESPSIKHALETLVKGENLSFQTKYCVIVDCDGSQDFRIIPRMIEELDRGSDLIVGSRYIFGGSSGSSNPFSQAGNVFARIVLGAKTKDLTGRYVAAEPVLLLKCCRWLNRGEDSIELIFKAEKRGCRIKEIPFVYRERIGGKSKTNIPKYLIKYFMKVLSIKFDSWRLYGRDYIIRGLARDYVESSESIKNTVWTEIIYFLQVPLFLIMSIPCRIPILEVLCNFIATNFPRGIIGFFLRGVYWKTRLGGMGNNCFLDFGVNIMGPENVYLGNNIHIDERCSLVSVSGYIRISDYVHVALNGYLQGKEGIDIGEYSTVSGSCMLYSATNYYKNEKGELMSSSAMAPLYMQCVKRNKIWIGSYSFVGAGTIIIPNGGLGDHSVAGSNSVVNEYIDDYKIAVGSPARVIGDVRYNG
jgi:acetyltransferase-like isoleucine patch superfamily enzyme